MHPSIEPVGGCVTLTVLGSGDAVNALGRSHSCYLLESAEAGPIAIDFGATALAALRRSGRQAGALRGLVFTHLHGDHIGGYPYLAIDMAFCAQRGTRLAVAGPRHTRARLQDLLQVTYGELLSDGARDWQTTIEIEPGEQIDIAGFSVEAFRAKHLEPPESALCLRVSTGDITVAFSGDTALCQGLMDAARDCDVLVAECSYLGAGDARHCGWADWLGVLDKLSCGRLILSHMGDEVRSKMPSLCHGDYGRIPVHFAEDGDVVVLRGHARPGDLDDTTERKC